MRLLYFADTRFPLERANGIQTFETCHALALRGHEVRLVVRRDTHRPPRDPFAFYEAPPADALRVRPVALSGPPALRRAMFLARALRLAARRDADVVFTRDLGVAATLLRLPRALRPPLVYESHGYAATVSAAMGALLSTARSASAAKQRRLARREWRVWRGAEGYVTITRALADELTARLGVRHHLAVVPDAARPPLPFEPPPDGRVRVAYAGHLYPWKGVDTLVRAAALVPDVEVSIVGGHPAEPDLARLRALAARVGVRERVTFVGMVPPGRVPALLREAHVLVLPNSATAVSTSYTSPLKLFEYLAAGRPIVASDLPAIHEAIDEQQAVFVPPDDPQALADALAALAVDGDRRDRMGHAAHRLAGACTWAGRAARLERLCAEVAAARR